MPTKSSGGSVISALSRIETNINYLTESSRKQEEFQEDVRDRLARLEESTSRAVPEVGVLRREVDNHEQRIGTLEGFRDGHCQEHVELRKATGNRNWDVWKMVLGPLFASLITWVLVKSGGGALK